MLTQQCGTTTVLLERKEQNVTIVEIQYIGCIVHPNSFEKINFTTNTNYEDDEDEDDD